MTPVSLLRVLFQDWRYLTTSFMGRQCLAATGGNPCCQQGEAQSWIGKGATRVSARDTQSKVTYFFEKA